MRVTNALFLGLFGLWVVTAGCGERILQQPAPTGSAIGAHVAVFPIEVSANRWGFMDNSGKLVIEARFGHAYPFQGAYSVVVSDHWKWGLLDRQGRYVIEPKYGLMLPPSEGLVCVADGGNNKIFYYGHYGFVDLSGRVAIKARLGMAWEFHEGLAAAMEYVDIESAKRGPKLGFIDHKGRWVIKPQFERIGIPHPEERMGFSEGVAVVKKGDLYGFIDRTGQFLVEPKFGYAGDFSEGLAPAKLTEPWNGKQDLGYINTQGDFVIEPQFAMGRSFSEGFAAVAVNYDPDDRMGLWGYINTAGKRVIEPRFYLADPFVDGWARVGVTGPEPPDYNGHGLVHKTGKVIFSRDYSFKGPFRAGLAPVEVWVGTERRIGYVDTEGNLVWDPRHRDIPRD